MLQEKFWVISENFYICVIDLVIKIVLEERTIKEKII